MILFALALLAAAPTFDEGLALKNAQKLPEAAAVFAALVQQHPRDVAALEQLATVQGWQGRYDEAIASWSRALAQRPASAALRVGYARVLYWKGELPEARRQIDAALRQTPEDVEALTLAGDIARAGRDGAGARAAYAHAARLDPSSAELARRLESVEPAPTHRVDVGATYDHYNDVRGSEGSFFVQAGFRPAETSQLALGYDELHQFGLVDRRIALSADHRASDRVLLNARVAVTPGASFLADWETWAGLEVAAAGGFTLLGDGRLYSYSSGEVGRLSPGLRFDAGPYSLQGSVAFTFAPGGQAASFQGRFSVAPSERTTLVLGFARGEEVVPRLATVVSTVGSAAFLFQATRRWGVRFDYALEHRVYVHNAFSSSMNWRF